MGVGILDLSKTYGKKKNKFLYLCRPEKEEPLLIPYNKPSQYDKSHDHYYVKYNNGIITHNFGAVDNLSNLYEYMIHSKELDIPQNANNKYAQSKCKGDIIEQMTIRYHLPRRTGHIFTIDSDTTTDYDDAISVSNNKVSIYISNVSLVLDYLGLWSLISSRVSTIYMPDKKRSMLPKVLEDICSLTKGQHKICLVLDLYIEETSIRKEFSVCNVKISRNYVYEESKLLNHTDYKLLQKYIPFKDSHELVSRLMITFNKECAIQMKHQGIYKPHTLYNPTTVEDYIHMYNTCRSEPYTTEKNEYLHITSPIRRLVDLLNMYSFTRNYISYSETANEIHNSWIMNIDKINENTKHIKQIQRDGLLHHLFEQNKHHHLKGYIFNKVDDKYDIYIPDLSIFTKTTCETSLEEGVPYTFKLYMIYDELYKKIQLEIIQ